MCLICDNRNYWQSTFAICSRRRSTSVSFCARYPRHERVSRSFPDTRISPLQLVLLLTHVLHVYALITAENSGWHTCNRKVLRPFTYVSRVSYVSLNAMPSPDGRLSREFSNSRSSLRGHGTWKACNCSGLQLHGRAFTGGCP